MVLSIYDTFSRKPSAITSLNGVVTMYCCGPTVYRDAHVGNLRTFLLSDLIARTIRLSGLSVEMIQNITDVGHMSDDFQLYYRGAARRDAFHDYDQNIIID